MNRNKSTRQSRLAAMLCLVAFLMLTVSANWHTCCVRHIHTADSHSVAITGLPHHDHCVACDMILNDTGRTTFTPSYSIPSSHSTVATVALLELTLVSVALINDSSRSPPSA